MSAYDDKVTSLGAAHYWRMDQSSGAEPNLAGAPTLAVTGAARQSTGPDQLGSACSFDGVNDSASAALNLSGLSALTLAMWINPGAYNSSDDDLLLEHTSFWGSNPGSLLVDMHNSTGGDETGTVSFGHNGNDGVYRSTFLQTALPTGVWSHLALTFDMAGAHHAYVNGEEIATLNRANATNEGSVFANSTLHVASRASSSLFCQAGLSRLAIFPALTSGQIADLASAQLTDAVVSLQLRQSSDWVPAFERTRVAGGWE